MLGIGAILPLIAAHQRQKAKEQTPIARLH